MNCPSDPEMLKPPYGVVFFVCAKLVDQNIRSGDILLKQKINKQEQLQVFYTL